MIGKLVRGFNESVRSYLEPRKQNVSYPVRVSLRPVGNTGSLRNRETGRLVAKEEAFKLCGETKNFSENEISFVVPFIRLGGEYLAGEGRVLNIVLGLPVGDIEFEAIGERYELVGEHSSVAKYMIAAKISSMREIDREKYKEFISGQKHFRKAAPGDLALHITQS